MCGKSIGEIRAEERGIRTEGPFPFRTEPCYNCLAMDSQTFERIALEAVAALPQHIRTELRDMAVVIRQRPEGRNMRPGSLLLGLYEGVPLTEWGRDFSGKLPDKITLFMEPIGQVAGSEEEIPRVIRETVWHEIGHYFGLNHTQIRKMEQRWRKSG